jgi:hypothetical protein
MEPIRSARASPAVAAVSLDHNMLDNNLLDNLLDDKKGRPDDDET